MKKNPFYHSNDMLPSAFSTSGAKTQIHVHMYKLDSDRIAHCRIAFSSWHPCIPSLRYVSS